MQRVILYVIAAVIGISACQRTEVAPEILAQEITLGEALRPIYLSSRIVNDRLEVSITPEGEFVCCCAPCTQPVYKPTAKYEVMIATGDSGPYSLYTTIDVGSKEQKAAQTITLPGELIDQPLAVRVVAMADNGKAGYVRAIMNSRSPVVTALTEVSTGDQNENFGLNFSQDKAQVVYATFVQDASYAIISTLYLADYSQGQLSNKRILTPSGYGGLFSRDGKKIAYFLPYQSPSSSRTLVIHDIATNTNQLIQLAGDLWVTSYSWSPDGKWIAFLEQNNAYSRLWKVNLADGTMQAITEATTFAQAGALWQGTIDWLPNGKAIAVTRKIRSTASDFRIGITQVSPTDGTLLADLNTLPGCIDKNPAYSSDGKKVVFISTRTSNQNDQYSIWIRDVTTSQLRQVRLPESLRLSDNFTPKWVGDNALFIAAYTGTPIKSRSFIVAL